MCGILPVIGLRLNLPMSRTAQLILQSPLKKAIAASFSAFVIMGGVNLLIYDLVSGFAPAQNLGGFAGQLLAISLFMSATAGVIAYCCLLGSQTAEATSETTDQTNVSLKSEDQTIGQEIVEATLDSTPENKPNSTPASNLSITPPQTQSITAFIVDDNAANRMVIDSFLQADNINTVVIDNGQETVELFQQHHPDIIFMDIEMDDMDGLQTTRAIRVLEKEDQRVPIVAVSAHSEAEHRYQALLVGYDDYLVKPIKDTQLYESLNRWCQINLDTQQTSTHAKITDNKQTEAPELDLPIIDVNHDTIEKTVSIEKSLEYSNQNKALACDMLQLLIKMIRDEKQPLMDLHQQQDWEKLGQLAHKLYGGSCYCGVEHLQAASKRVDVLMQNKEYEDIDQAMTELLLAIEELLLWDEQYDVEIIFT